MENPEESTSSAPKPVRQTPAWLSTSLRWGLVVLVAVVLGAVFITLVYHLPLQRNFKQVSSDLDSANAQVSDLTDQVSELTASIETLQQAVADRSLQLAITLALADVRASKLAIVADDPAGARLAVTRVIQALDTLAELIDKDNRDIVANMQDKADQANTDLQASLTTAIPVLDQLEANLVSIHNTLFPIP